MFLPKRRLSPALLYFFLTLAGLGLAGCSDDGVVYENASSNLAAGNWQIGSTAAAAARVGTLSGQLGNRAGQITGTFHTQNTAACVSPNTPFVLSGGADEKSRVTLTGAVGGGSLTVAGTLAPDGRSLTGASYSIVGGACGLRAAVEASAQVYAPVSGTYAGSFADADGRVAQVTADFSQSTAPDQNGNFTLAGTASVTGNPCFPAAVAVSNTQVTGGTFAFTYSANGASVTAQGTFSQDANTLSITSWTSSGSCGSDAGVASTMSRRTS